MNKYKVAVYAIAKNESKFVDRWYNSVKEADEIYVLDTGSTDDTFEKLQNHNIHVIKKEITPWRFDVARNISLNMIPNNIDICVCLDLDEIIKSGWRKKLERIWQEDATRLRYIYNWSLDNFDNPIISFYGEKIHSRKNFKWVNAVHEILKCDVNEKFITTNDIVINHYPDNNKSRSSYLPLLELSVKEDPNNDRNMHYLGREYMYYKKYQEAIDTLERHLKLKSATWKDERCASMRFIARSYHQLNRDDEAIFFYDKAIKEAPYLRDPYMEKAILMYELKDYRKCEKLIRQALKIKINAKSYINEVFTFDHSAYDMLSLIEYNKGNYKKALFYVKKALKISPNNERLLTNKKIIQELI